MALGSDRYGSRADTAVFLLCLVLGLVALALPARIKEPVAGAVRGTVLRPVLAVQRRAVTAAESRDEFLRVRAERDSLTMVTHALPELSVENARLRALLGLGARLGRGFRTAEVLHQAGVSDGLTLVLSAGRAGGVEASAPVLADRGLLGVVLTADASTSVALAWSHPDFRASAMVEGLAVHGIVRARRGEVAGEVMELTGVPFREQLVPGTRVLTSGLGGVFPRGIPLGTVQGVLTESAGWERTYLLRPAVHPADAAHVIVLSPSRARDTLAAAFAGPAAGADTVLVIVDTSGVRVQRPPERPLRRRAAIPPPPVAAPPGPRR